MVKEQMWALRGCQCMKKQVATLRLEIIIHKHMAGLYDLEPDEHFESFLQAVEPLDEEQSYTLSCQLEPPAQRAGRKDCYSSSGPTFKRPGPGPAAVIGPAALLVSWLHVEESCFPSGQVAPGAPGPQSACCSSSSRCSS
ncbi:ral guanine nucleotide dissociation stimulator-like 2 isoform X3 [Manis pentadactyla]|uniref:ral guanine nucleotide dissociation stimulator-like 2 isoform X3 n=1 Tax=Manis pentadactyla TaxID=143292 RepID=UPI00255D1130|nr:ral guanine nucleotide dissociation stimulator-like 2 isoform X3 [Manis pentadactyla]